MHPAAESGQQGFCWGSLLSETDKQKMARPTQDYKVGLTYVLSMSSHNGTGFPPVPLQLMAAAYHGHIAINSSAQLALFWYVLTSHVSYRKLIISLLMEYFYLGISWIQCPPFR